MEPQIKALAEAITHGKTQQLIQAHVKDLSFDEQAKHLIIYVDNVNPMHELSNEEGDRHLNAGLEKIYGADITYEVKMHGEGIHEREKQVPHNINQ